MNNLAVIEFINNQIGELDPSTYNGLTNLVKIDFRVNLITNMHNILENK